MSSSDDIRGRAGGASRPECVHVPPIVEHAADVLFWAGPWDVPGYRPPATQDDCRKLALVAMDAALEEVERLRSALEAIRLTALHEGRPESDDFAHRIYELASEASS